MKQEMVDKIEMVPVGQLKPWPKNPRHNELAVEPVAKSMENFGMLVPLVINKKNEILAGETRWKGAMKNGYKKIPCVRVEHLTKEEQTAFNIADNKLSEIASWNEDMLKEILTDLQKQFTGAEYDFSRLGFQPAEVNLMLTGWSSNAQRMGDIKPDDGVAPGKIIIACKQEEEEIIREQLQSFFNEQNFKDIELK